MKMRAITFLGSACIATGLAGTLACNVVGAAGKSHTTASRPLTDWPQLHSAIARDPDLEARIAKIVAAMTLAQKVGQMTQAEIKSITPEQVRQYYLGSVLNGGGSWPGQDKHARVADWVKLADAYYDASMSTDMPAPVPIIWGTDAVHGHGNVYGATLFPHNIGLGATRDPDLVAGIGAATARAVRATGIDWVFAPAVPVVQNTRWGRTYESFSEDGALVRAYAKAYTHGLQGRLGDDAGVVATAKHFIGDGGTENGKDQGLTVASLPALINLHGQGYYGAIEAGVQTVMASYNSWKDADSGVDHGKMHGNRELLTGALKDRIGFDGFIVSDWNAIGQLPGCSNASCPQAINAGIDMMMVPDDWKAFIDNTVRQVEHGEIPISRIDDAVTRVLRVKMRAGLFDGRKPSANRYAGRQDAIQDRALARRAVRESLVLLKNDRAVLPLKRGRKILVVGKSADSVPNQAGGWSLTWQGTENSNADFPAADSILDGIREAVGAGNVTFRENADGVNIADFDAVIAVVGETPYAETTGDIVPSSTLSHSARHPEDLAVLQAISGKGKPVATVFLSGRPLYVNDLLNLSDAFVAAWLPGSEGKGVADVLFANADGGVDHDFRGTLPFAWPGVGCPVPATRRDAAHAPLFERGYGLRYANARDVGPLSVAPPTETCGPPTTLPVFGLTEVAPFALYVSAGGAERAVGSDPNAMIDWPAIRVRTESGAKLVTWLGPARILARGSANSNLKPMAMADGALLFDIVVSQAPKGAVTASMECGRGCRGTVDLAETVAGYGVGVKRTAKIPLACFAVRGTDVANVDVPFSVSASVPFAAAFSEIRIVAGAAKDADALRCDGVPGGNRTQAP